MAKTVRTALRPEETVGYCVVCNRLVARTADAGCSNGHESELVHGLAALPQDGAVPELPRFNWGAFLMPPVWGVGHGSWAGVLVLPLWLFTDSAFQAAYFTSGTMSGSSAVTVWAMPILMAIATVALMLWYGFRGWGLAWRRKFDRGENGLTFEQFMSRERRWIFVSAPLLVFAVALAIYFWTVVLLPSGGVIPGK